MLLRRKTAAEFLAHSILAGLMPAEAMSLPQEESREDYRFRPHEYIRDVLGYKLWRGTTEHPGQAEIVDAYELALRQQYERLLVERGELTVEQCSAYVPGTVIKNHLHLSGGHGFGKCVAANEWITLSDGQRCKAIDLVGKTFNLLTLVNNEIQSVEARAAFNAIEPVWELTTNRGKKIVRNAEHPLFSARLKTAWGRRPRIDDCRFRPISEIVPGDVVAIAENLPAWGECSLSDDELKIIAYLIGDGGLTTGSVRFSQQENAQLEEVKSIVARMGCEIRYLDQYDYVITGKGWRNNHIQRLLKDHGLYKKHSRDKCVPSAIFTANARQLALFLSRLYATDGWASIDKNGRCEIGFCSASESLCQDVVYLLQKLGIHSIIRRKAKVNAWVVDIHEVTDLCRFVEIIGIYGKEKSIEAIRILAQPILDCKERNIAERKDRPRWYHKNAPNGTRWEKVLSIRQLQNPVATIAIEVPNHHTFLTQFYEHNTVLMALICRHFYDNFLPSVTYCFAPTLNQLRNLFWKEVGEITKQAPLEFGRLYADGAISDVASHFVESIAVPTGDSTEKIQGQHAAYQLYIVDEAEGVGKAFWASREALIAGGISIVLMSGNPKTRTSNFYSIQSDPRVVSFVLDCIYHPNVIENREIVPSAVRRDYIEAQLKNCADIVSAHDVDAFTFSVPWSSDVIYKPHNEFLWRVRGIAPADSTDRNLISVGRFQAACQRARVSNRPEFVSIGVDSAWDGLDKGTVYVRHDGACWLHAELSKENPSSYYFAIKDALRIAKENGALSAQVRFDAGGGYSSGAIELLEKDDEIKQWFGQFKVFRVHFGATGSAVHKQDKYYDVITELTADVAESLLGVTVINPHSTLQHDLCLREYEPRNLHGRFVKKLQNKGQFKTKQGRSPDHGDGFVLAMASEFLFKADDWSFS